MQDEADQGDCQGVSLRIRDTAAARYAPSYASEAWLSPTIPRKSNERHRGRFDKELYKLRNMVERLFNRLKQYRRIATRYEKVAENYRAMLVVASILLWL